MDAVKKVLYPNLRAEMARRGDKLQDLADLFNTSLPSINRRLSGEIVWDINEINALCNRYNVPFEILFKRGE